jgi:hypothetical protein
MNNSRLYKRYTGKRGNSDTNSQIFYDTFIIFLYILNIEPPTQSSVQRLYMILQKLSIIILSKNMTGKSASIIYFYVLYLFHLFFVDILTIVKNSFPSQWSIQF